MFSSTGMNRGGWREGPKKGTKEKLEDLTADLKITLVNLNEKLEGIEKEEKGDREAVKGKRLAKGGKRSIHRGGQGRGGRG